MKNDGGGFWYADGYHAGLFLRSRESLTRSLWEILRGLKERPYWKVNLEIEGFAMELLAESDPELVVGLREAIQNEQMEIVGGSYTQPLPWVIDGESVIRQMRAGIGAIAGALGGYQVLTYAVQEPCWSSQLPQILTGLGFRWCALKNHFAYFGRPPKCAHEKALWVGPDGSKIEVSPSYLPFPDKAFNDPGVRGGEDYIKACREAGIERPIAFYIEDIGGAPPAYVADPPPSMRFALWREYFQASPPAAEPWPIGLEDFRLALHWGAQSASVLAQACHRLQAEVESTERLRSLASLLGGLPYPEEELAAAWKTLLRLQHHDPWLVPDSRLGMFADHPFPWWVEQWSAECHEACRKVSQAATAALGGARDAASGGHDASRVVRVINVLGAPREDLVTLDEGRETTVTDAAGRKLQSQLVGGKTLFLAEVPGFGYRDYRIHSAGGGRGGTRPNRRLTIASDGSRLSVKNDFYEAELDPERGGCLTKLRERTTGRELLAGRLGPGNDLAASFAHCSRHVRSSEAGATLTLLDQGPVQTSVLVEGLLSAFPFRSRLLFAANTPRIDFDTQIQLGVGAWAGEPFVSAHWTNRRQSWHVDRKKLQVQFPVDLPGARLYKDAAFEVIESRLEEPFHESWDDVKTNTILGWVDVSDGVAGLAVFTDRTTSYGYARDWPLSLVLGWGSLAGAPSFRYSILPHAGDWREARLPLRAQERETPLIAVPLSVAGSLSRDSDRSLISIEPPSVLLSAAFREEGAWFIRLFNSMDSGQEAIVRLSASITGNASYTDLAGKVLGPLPVESKGSDTMVRVALRPFGLQTIRLG